jgi:hypothetical protein
MKMQLIHTFPGDKNFELFESLPALIYAADSLRLQQGDAINREFLESCIVLLQGEKPIARAAVYNNPGLFYEEMKAAAVGNYECIDDPIAAKMLLGEVRLVCRKMGAAYLIGPMNGSTWDNYRFSSHHQHPNFLLEPYHQLYYNQQFTTCGFEEIANYNSSIDTNIICDHAETLKREAFFIEQGICFRTIDMDNYELELKKLYPFISNAFSSNFLYSPISWESFREKYLAAAKIIKPEYVMLAEDSEGQLLSLIFCYEDLYNRKEKSLVIKTIARDANPKWAGLGGVLGNRLMRAVQKAGFESVVHAFMIQDATSLDLSQKYLGTFYKNYKLYGQKL